MNHNFDIELANKYGLEEAIILQNIAFWIKKNKANNKHFINENYWTYNSIKAFNELFPYLTKNKIIRALNNLKKNKIITIANHNKDKHDRTKWYAITDKTIANKYNINYQNPKMKVSKTEMHFLKTEMELSKNRNDNKVTDIKPDIKKNNKKDFFSKIYKLYNPKCRIIPLNDKKLFNRFIKALEYLKSEEALEKVITEYLNYLKVATWRRKTDFKFLLNDYEKLSNNWIEEKRLEENLSKNNKSKNNENLQEYLDSIQKPQRRDHEFKKNRDNIC